MHHRSPRAGRSRRWPRAHPPVPAVQSRTRPGISSGASKTRYAGAQANPGNHLDASHVIGEHRFARQPRPNAVRCCPSRAGTRRSGNRPSAHRAPAGDTTVWSCIRSRPVRSPRPRWRGRPPGAHGLLDVAAVRSSRSTGAPDLFIGPDRIRERATRDDRTRASCREQGHRCASTESRGRRPMSTWLTICTVCGRRRGRSRSAPAAA